MKRFLLLFVLLLFSNVAIAADYAIAANAYYWRDLGRGYYTKVDGSGYNDGWYYTRASTCSYYCGRSYTNYSYARYARIATYYPQKATPVVAYSANWKSDLVRALDKKQDNEFFLRSIRESGLATGGGFGVPGVGAYAAVGAYGQGYAKGVTTYSQGYQQPYADQGSTVYGLSSYAPGIGQIDIEGLMQTQARIVERLAQSTTESNYAFSDRIEQLSTSQTELAKIREAGNILVETMKAAQQPKTLTQQWESGAKSQTGGGGDYAPTDDERPLQSAPQGDFPNENGHDHSHEQGSNGQESWAVSVVRAENYFNQACVSCHSGATPKGGLDLAELSLWKKEQFQEYGPKIEYRMSSKDPSVMMPPPTSKKRGPDKFEGRALAAIFSRKE